MKGEQQHNMKIDFLHLAKRENESNEINLRKIMYGLTSFMCVYIYVYAATMMDVLI